MEDFIIWNLVDAYWNQIKYNYRIGFFSPQTNLERKNPMFKNLNMVDKPTTLTEAWFDSWKHLNFNKASAFNSLFHLLSMQIITWLRGVRKALLRDYCSHLLHWFKPQLLPPCGLAWIIWFKGVWSFGT